MPCRVGQRLALGLDYAACNGCRFGGLRPKALILKQGSARRPELEHENKRLAANAVANAVAVAWAATVAAAGHKVLDTQPQIEERTAGRNWRTRMSAGPPVPRPLPSCCRTTARLGKERTMSHLRCLPAAQQPDPHGAAWHQLVQLPEINTL